MSSILVIDDDQPAADLFAAILRHFGYHTTAATNGPAALRSMQTSPPDLVFLDVMMPDMNGLEVLRRIRTDEKTAHLPVIMFSALDDDEWKDRAKHAGADDYWIKGGLDFGELEDRVRSRLIA